MNLNQWKHLFRSPKEFEDFVAKLSQNNGRLPLLVGDRYIGCLLSPAATKTMLYESMVRRIVESPELLKELEESLTFVKATTSVITAVRWISRVRAGRWHQ